MSDEEYQDESEVELTIPEPELDTDYSYSSDQFLSAAGKILSFGFLFERGEQTQKKISAQLSIAFSSDL